MLNVSRARAQKAEAAGAKLEGGKERAEIQDTSLPGMAFMMECYEGELKRPIRNLVNGRLLRTILIQVGIPPSKVLWGAGASNDVMKQAAEAAPCSHVKGSSWFPCLA